MLIPSITNHNVTVLVDNNLSKVIQLEEAWVARLQIIWLREHGPALDWQPLIHRTRLSGLVSGHVTSYPGHVTWCSDHVTCPVIVCFSAVSWPVGTKAWSSWLKAIMWCLLAGEGSVVDVSGRGTWGSQEPPTPIGTCPPIICENYQATVTSLQYLLPHSLL